MKVMQLMAGAEFGGAESFFIRLAIALSKAGLVQKVVIRRNQTRAQQLRDAKIEPVELSFGGRLDLVSRWSIRRQISEFKPDIVLSWMNRATSMTPQGGFKHVGRLGGYYNLKYYRKCDELVANTQDIAEYLHTNGWPEEKTHYLPNFVGGARAKPIDRQEFFTPASAPLILGMGRFHENKGFDILLAAISRVPNVYLWLAGEGPLRKELEDQAEVLGIKPRVRFLGWREDPEALYATADLFVCPSRHEPLGNVIIEAWAQGVPVVATDSLGPGTLISQGETGILSPVNDINALARIIRQVIEDDSLLQRLAAKGYGAYEAKYTESTIVDTYMKFFERLMDNT